MKAVLWIILIIVIVLIAWWAIYYFYYSVPSSATGPATYVPTSTSAIGGPGSPASMQTVLATSTNASLGAYLTAPNGMTLYYYTKDTPNSGTSTCSGQCATLWPPYVVSSTAIAAGTLAGATGTIGVITRGDGSLQITYNGWPLYFYSKDAAPGDTTGQAVNGVWYVVAP